MTLLLYLVADGGRRGYKNLLDAFWDECDTFGMNVPAEQPVSAVAFCKARRKLKAPLLRALIHEAASGFAERHGAALQWKGHRVLACDGSKISLQRAEALSTAFGGPVTGHCPQMLVSTLYDVIAGVPVDVSVAAFASCERTELLGMLDCIHRGDVLLLDRGYPSFAVFTELIRRGIHFVVRVPVDHTFKAVEDFILHGGCDETIRIHPPHDYKSGGKPIDMRAVYWDRDNDDECVVFLTNLPETHSSAAEIQDLYGRRWAVEELYKIEKGDYLGQRQFHAKYADGIRQEVYAFALFISMSRTLMAKAAETHSVDYDDLSQKAALLAVAAYITRLCVDPRGATLIATVERLLVRIARNLDPPRPGRSFPRRSFKPKPRWGAHGRVWEPRNGG